MPTIFDANVKIPMGEYYGEDMNGLWDSLKTAVASTTSKLTTQATTAATQAVTQAKATTAQAVQSATQKATESVVSQSQLLTNKALTTAGLAPTVTKVDTASSAPAKVLATTTNVNVNEIARSVESAPMTTAKKAGLSVGVVVGLGVAGFLFWKFILNKKG